MAGPAHFLQYIYVRRREFGERDEGVAARQAIVERLKPIFARSNVNNYLARSDPIFRETDIERPPLAAIGYRNILVRLQEAATAPLPYPISEMNLSNWRRGGHQDWRQEQMKQQVLARGAAGRSSDSAPPRRFPGLSAPFKA